MRPVSEAFEDYETSYRASKPVSSGMGKTEILVKQSTREAYDQPVVFETDDKQVFKRTRGITERGSRQDFRNSDVSNLSGNFAITP